MKVGDLVRYSEKSCWGFSVESSFDMAEYQKKIAGFGIIIAAEATWAESEGVGGRAPETVVVWWPKFGEAWEPIDRLEIISEA